MCVKCSSDRSLNGLSYEVKCCYILISTELYQKYDGALLPQKNYPR